MTAAPGPLGIVAGVPVPGALLDARLAELRAGPMADLLPPEGCLEGRRLRRWIAQLVLTEELVRAEARRLGVPDPTPGPETGCRTGVGPVPPAFPAMPGWRGGHAGPYPHPATPGPRPAGSLASAVLAGMPLARAVYRRVTGGIRVGERQARDYYRRNSDLWKQPERRRLLHVVSTRPPDPHSLHTEGTWLTCTRDELPESLAQLAFSAAQGAVVGPVITPFGWQVALIGGITPAAVASFATVRDKILTRLTRSACDRYFERWIELRRSELVTVAPGCEHPGDPRHSDYAHHH